MTEDTFREVATIAWVAFGLGATLLLGLMAVIGSWRLFRHASEASLASMRATLAMEELARELARDAGGAASPPGAGNFADLHRQAEELMDRQGRLQEMTRSLLDMAAIDVGPTAPALDELEHALERLESTVSQMAAALANLTQQMEQREG